MIDGLPGVTADVEDEAVSAVPHPSLPRHGVRRLEDPFQHTVPVHLASVRQVTAWDHQRVQGRLRLHVLEGHHLVILVDDPRRSPAGGYLAEDALCHSRSEGTLPAGSRGQWGL